MNDIDPEYPASLAMLAWGVIANAHEGDWSKATVDWREAATRWRDQFHTSLAEQPRVIELPEEDRTRKWEDAVGNVWEPMYSKTWWTSPGYREPQEWHALLARGPLTDAGPA